MLKMKADTYNTERASFAERAACLAGRTTYRVPVGGHGTRSDYMPTEHAISAAFAFARRGPGDIGPDIAVAIATGNTAHRMKIVRELAAALLASTGSAGERCADALLKIAAHCYLSVLGIEPGAIPEGVDVRDYGALREFGERILWQAADDAYRRAAARYTRAE